MRKIDSAYAHRYQVETRIYGDGIDIVPYPAFTLFYIDTHSLAVALGWCDPGLDENVFFEPGGEIAGELISVISSRRMQHAIPWELPLRRSQIQFRGRADRKRSALYLFALLTERRHDVAGADSTG